MNYARIAVIIVVLILFARLNWWVLPHLAIVHFAKENAPIQESGNLLAHHEHFKLKGITVIDFLERGWSGVLAAWPYLMIGSLFGVVLGFFAGDQARRILAIDVASKRAVNEAAKLIEEAHKVGNLAQRRVADACKMEKDLKYRLEFLEKVAYAQQKERSELEKMKAGLEEKARRAESTETELKKARNKIRRLEVKIGRMENDPIDDF
ncbi:MAG: hypothetical protein EG822_05575 [Deltaproteobacteria bacterium]|nr:hypothetical protein [Deltaproteobacteria bacterium]TLN02713.1 MAG: hypothetical protein FDZ73_10720 [bacterium]